MLWRDSSASRVMRRGATLEGVVPSGVARLNKWSVTIRPPVLNADSAATVDAVTDNTSRIIPARIGYFGACIFYQCNMSKLSLSHRNKLAFE